MSRKTTEEKIKSMQDLYNTGLPLKEISLKLNIPYSTVYTYTRLWERGFRYFKEYEAYLVEVRKTPSYPYGLHQIRQRQRRKENLRLSKLIRTRLNELNKNQYWLSRQLGVTRQTVSLYASGKVAPRKDLQKKLFSTLGLKYETLDDILKLPT